MHFECIRIVLGDSRTLLESLELNLETSMFVMFRMLAKGQGSQKLRSSAISGRGTIGKSAKSHGDCCRESSETCTRREVITGRRGSRPTKWRITLGPIWRPCLPGGDCFAQYQYKLVSKVLCKSTRGWPSTRASKVARAQLFTWGTPYCIGRGVQSTLLPVHWITCSI